MYLAHNEGKLSCLHCFTIFINTFSDLFKILLCFIHHLLTWLWLKLGNKKQNKEGLKERNNKEIRGLIDFNSSIIDYIKSSIISLITQITNQLFSNCLYFFWNDDFFLYITVVIKWTGRNCKCNEESTALILSLRSISATKPQYIEISYLYAKSSNHNI